MVSASLSGHVPHSHAQCVPLSDYVPHSHAQCVLLSLVSDHAVAQICLFSTEDTGVEKSIVHISLCRQLHRLHHRDTGSKFVGWSSADLSLSLSFFLSLSLSVCLSVSLSLSSHLLNATVRVCSLVAPCHLPDLTSLALLGSVSGQRRLSRGLLPGDKTVSKWRLQLQDSTPFPLLSQRFCTTLHTSASLGCYFLFTLMPDCPLAPLGQVWQQ